MPEKPSHLSLPVGGPGRRIFYLDDDEALVFLVRRLLTRAGFAVTAFTRPDDALRVLRIAPDAFDLVLTDFNMPGFSGLDIARDVQRMRPALPVVLVSGQISDELRADALAAGVRRVLYKPHTAEELCAAIEGLWANGV